MCQYRVIASKRVSIRWSCTDGRLPPAESPNDGEFRVLTDRHLAVPIEKTLDLYERDLRYLKQSADYEDRCENVAIHGLYHGRRYPFEPQMVVQERGTSGGSIHVPRFGFRWTKSGSCSSISDPLS